MGEENNKPNEVELENTDREKVDPELVSYIERALTPEGKEERNK